MSERLKTADRLNGVANAVKAVCRVLAAAVPHLHELLTDAKDPDKIARTEALICDVTSQVREVPVAKLEAQIINEGYGPNPSRN